MKIKLLIYDSHENFRQTIRELLRPQTKIEVVAEAKDASTLLMLVGDHKPDIVVLGTSTEEHPCAQLVQSIQDLFPSINIIITSLHANSRFAQAMLTAGASSYLLKDNLPTELVIAVRKVTAGEQFVSPSLVPLPDPQSNHQRKRVPSGRERLYKHSQTRKEQL